MARKFQKLERNEENFDMLLNSTWQSSSFLLFWSRNFP